MKIQTGYLIVWLSLLLVFWVGSGFLLDVIVIRLLVTLNIVSFSLFGLDKLQARIRGKRVPEKILWLSAFLGGPIGALAGMHLFRHKTKKASFQLILALLIFAEILLIIRFYPSILPML